MSPITARYHNRFLFDYGKEETGKCMGRLAYQADLYKSGDARLQRRMRIRALFTAALTLNATAVWTARLLARGTFSMITQSRFFWKRWKLDPKEWGQNAKSCFARALCGYSVGKDAVCIDRHLERMGLSPEDAAGQWLDWFRLYESLYGPGEKLLCVKWHVGLLDWISGMGSKPSPWKGSNVEKENADRLVSLQAGVDPARPCKEEVPILRSDAQGEGGCGTPDQKVLVW